MRTSSPTGLLERLRSVDRELDTPELVEIVRAVADSGVWRDLVVVERQFRDYRLLFENEHLDVWVLSWTAGQQTGFHDHDVSSVGLTVVQGTLLESSPRWSGPPVERLLVPGDVREGGLGYVHRCAHVEGDPAVSIHAYSPLLRRVGQYREAPDGTVLRFPAPGRTRLEEPAGPDALAAA